MSAPALINFTRVRNELLDAAPSLTPSELRCALVIAEEHDRACRGDVTVSAVKIPIRRFSERTGLDKLTVYLALSRLRNSGHIIQDCAPGRRPYFRLSGDPR